MATLIDSYKSRYSATQEEVMSLADYLDLCRRDPSAYAYAAERMLAAIGQPNSSTRGTTRACRASSPTASSAGIPAFREFYGMDEAINQIVSFFLHAAQGLEERKQILYLLGPVGGGKSSLAERLKLLMETQPIYAIEGSPVNESPLGLFNPDQHADELEQEYGIPRRCLTGIMSPWAVKRLHEFGGDMSRFTRGPPLPVHPAPDGDCQDRAGRREQPGHLVARRQGRHPQAGPVRPARPRRLQLRGRPVSRQPGPARVRGDVQGADQDAAPAAHGHPGRQLQGDRGLRGDSVPGDHPRALERGRVAELPQQQAERGLPRSHLHRQGAVLPAGVGGGADLPETPEQQFPRPVTLRPGHARDAGAVLGAEPPQGAGELERLLEDAGVRRRESQGHRPQGQVVPGIPRRTPGPTRA